MEGKTDIYNLSRRDIMKMQLFAQSRVHVIYSQLTLAPCSAHAVGGVGAMIYCKKVQRR